MAAIEHEAPDTADTSLRPTHEPSALRGHLGRWVMGAAVAIVVAALAAVLLGRAGLSAGSGGASRSWQTYHDSLGLFTLQLPPGWTVVDESGTGGFGDRQGGVSEREDLVSFDNPAQGTGSAHITVFAIPLKTALAHQVYCRDSNTPQQRFSPTTLHSLEPSGIWFFTTENASFQVNVTIPGVVAPEGHGPPPPAATPIPATWAATDKSEVNAMLASFQPTNPKPLTC